MRRSLLYVPADRPERFAKAFAARPDAVLVDLEDAVVPAARPRVRADLPAALSRIDRGSTELWLRINSGSEGCADAALVAQLGATLDGVLAAKTEDPGWLDELAAHLADEVALAGLVESAKALRRLDALAGHPRVTQLHLGEIDLVADVGATGAGAEQIVAHARRELMLVSAASAIEPPIGGVETAIADDDRLIAGSATLRDLGFGGRAAVHPRQVVIINDVFTPSITEIEAAGELVRFYDAARAAGRGAVADGDGKMVDEALVRRARRLLASNEVPPAR